MRSEIFQFQSMSNAISCIDQRFAFMNSRISCLALIFNLKNLRTTVLYAKKIGYRWRNTTSHNRFFQKIDTSQWLSGKGESSEFGDMGSIPDEC